MRRAGQLRIARPALATSGRAHAPLARKPAPSPSPLIELQKQIGNGSVNRLLADRPSAPAPIQRKIGTTSAQVAALRSTSQRGKAVLGLGTFRHLVRALKDYERCEQKDELAYVDVVAGLAEYWLKHNKKATNDARKSLIEDLAAQAKAEIGKLQAMDKYLKDMKGGKVNALSTIGEQFALGQAETLAKGETGGGGASAAALELARKYGLTEPEMAAIKLYTASDYLYINPATANSQGWMGAQEEDVANNAVEKAPRSKKDLMEMGSMHAGAIMQALSKFPPVAMKTYRGSRESPETFRAKYQDTNVMKFGAFGSSASSEYPAEKFARGEGENSPLPHQTVSVFCILEVTNGRQLGELSIYGAGENEVLLLPGAEFSIGNIEQHDSGLPGRPPATAWYTVHLTQTK